MAENGKKIVLVKLKYMMKKRGLLKKKRFLSSKSHP